MKRILVAILAISCSHDMTPAPTTSLAQLEQPMLGVVGSDPNPLTFWWWAGNGAELRPALECALERIRAATCLPVDISLDAHHWVRVLVHEIAQHILQRRNDAGHVPPMFRISEQLITNICAVQASLGYPCGCSNPETDDNPVESTQGACVE